MYRKLYACLPLLICCITLVSAQNLVPNPSFETYQQCPTGISQFFWNVSQWNVPNAATTDYFHTCATDKDVQVPGNFMGYQPPHSGNAFAGIYTWQIPVPGYPEYREYMQAQLLQPLEPGGLYEVSFYVSIADFDSSNPYGSVILGTDGFGAYLSDTAVLVYHYDVLPFKPQVESPQGQPITDTAGWVKVSGYLIGEGQEYIILGNFRRAAQTTIIQLPTPPLPPGWPTHFPWFYDTIGYAFIDDVSVTAVSNITASNDTMVCDTTGLHIQLNAAGGFTSYLWSNGSTAPSIHITKPGTYWYAATIDNTTFYDTIRVRYYERIHMPRIPDQAVCEGKAADLYAFPGYLSYTWIQGSHTGTGIHYRTLAAGDVILAAADSCGLQLDTIGIMHKELPPPPAVADTTVCLNSIITHLPANGSDLMWHITPGDAGQSTMPVISTATRTPVTLYVSQTVNGCTGPAAEITVGFYEEPEMQLADDTVFCSNAPGMIHVRSNMPVTYRWSSGDTTPYIRPAVAGIYTVEAHYICGQVHKTTDVRIEQCGQCIWMPDAFTPNGDGRNDAFGAAHNCIVPFHEYMLTIYNRWGALIFLSSDLSYKWDGHLNGIPCEVGTYGYMLRYKYDTMPQAEIIKGNVMLLR